MTNSLNRTFECALFDDDLIDPPTAQYPGLFQESGLPAGTSGQVILGTSSNTSTGSLAELYVPNGTYDFSVGMVGIYQPSPGSGSVKVDGMEVNVSITFAEEATFVVTFNEVGLAPGAPWEVLLAGGIEGGSTNSAVTVEVPNGTYPFWVDAAHYVSNDSPGNLTVAGAPMQEPVGSTAAPYRVTFASTGLASETVWQVTLGNLAESATGPLTFLEPNGTFGFSVRPVAGFYAVPPSGSVTVQWADETVTVAFLPGVRPAFLPVVFLESGLPKGTEWGIALAGSNRSTTGTSLNFTELNGSYA
ncbi:MAG: hypothetical protein ACREC5_01665 [Thermoplasmata archaeon]